MAHTCMLSHEKRVLVLIPKYIFVCIGVLFYYKAFLYLITKKTFLSSTLNISFTTYCAYQHKKSKKTTKSQGKITNKKSVVSVVEHFNNFLIEVFCRSLKNLKFLISEFFSWALKILDFLNIWRR